MPKPTLYDQWVADGELERNVNLIESLAMQGYAQKEIAQLLGISEVTFTRMKKAHPEIKTAIKKNREYVVAELQPLLLTNCRKGDTTAIIYALKTYGGDFFKRDKEMPVDQIVQALSGVVIPAKANNGAGE